MEIDKDIRAKINQIDGLATEVHEYLYEIDGNDEYDETEEQLENRTELMSALININNLITSLQESEGWI